MPPPPQPFLRESSGGDGMGISYVGVDVGGGGGAAAAPRIVLDFPIVRVQNSSPEIH